MDKYYELLIEQYKSAREIKNFDVNDPNFMLEFKNWLKEQEKSKNDYLKLLESLGIDYDRETCIEVGKGKEDSLFVPFRTTIVSPYMDESIKRDGLTLSKDTKIIDNDLLVVMNGGINQVIPVYGGRIYLTQNVYNERFLYDWPKLAKTDTVVVGVFGNTNDSDMTKKIRAMREFERTLDDYEYNHGEINDTYCYAVKSKRK